MEGILLKCKADFHLGAHVTKFVRVRIPSRQADTVLHGVIFGTLDGGLGALIPIEEGTYQRLIALQARLYHSVSHMAGMNPKAFRHLKAEKKLIRNIYHNILDGDLLYRYSFR